ncbi:MAG: Flp pilus assembly complex ATPase component TadA [Planctomycetes bacterium]|nr:Flp pilus assembly complex ATPase component TadA [Planctomycetota bacterium]
MPFLEVKGGPKPRRIELDGSSVTFGRLADNVVAVDDSALSRKHCVIECVEGVWQVRDLESRNGTRVNGGKIATRRLRNLDVIRIGKLEIRFVSPDESLLKAGPQEPETEDETTSQPEAGPGPAGLESLPSIPLEREAGVRRDRPKQKVALPGLNQGKPAAPAPIANTIDIDLNAVVGAGSLGNDPESRLRKICDEAMEKPFEASDISLVDMRGQIVHQAAGMGGEDDDDASESIRVFRLVLLTAFRSRASDVHVEPRMDRATIRLRVDGLMVLAAEIPLDLLRRLLGMVKILCQIDTSQKSQVQDGHFSTMTKGRRVDFRVSLTPAIHGQKLVLRVLDTANSPTRLHELGVLPWMYEKLRTMANRDSGMVLACGPTGSGKTTTLYSCLREIDVETRNAITIEDPVEYYLEGCTQIPIDHKQGNTFANILRSVLRQDPDVIFVGEIRDIETAQVAMQAAMTGHLVYSTVHSRDSMGAIFRLLDLGVESYLVANAINLIVAQRLCRSLCLKCRKAVRPTPSQLLKMGRAGEGMPSIFSPVGCGACLGTGYRGRRALLELLEFSEGIRDVVLKRPTIADLRTVLAQGHYITLQNFGFQLVAQGVTSYEEVERVAGGD